MTFWAHVRSTCVNVRVCQRTWCTCMCTYVCDFMCVPLFAHVTASFHSWNDFFNHSTQSSIWISKLRCSTVYMCAHMHECRHSYIRACVHMRTCVCVRVCACVRVCMRVCARVCDRVSKRCMSAWQHHSRQWEGSQPSVALRAACAAFPPAALECRASAIYMINTHDAAA